MNKNILITGSAGFIGFHLCKKLILNGSKITGIDNLNNYYDIELKKKRLEILSKLPSKNNWQFFPACPIQCFMKLTFARTAFSR